MLVFAIESSCDDTAAAFLKDGYQVQSSVVNSQIEMHKKHGGIVPELASRAHLEAIWDVVHGATEKAEISDFNSVDLLAVTRGPGLMGSLMIGSSFMKGLAMPLDKPLVCVDHVESHIYSARLDQEGFSLKEPTIALVVSGGHTNIYYIEDRAVQLLGYTIDDACGESFDKVSKLLGFSYPGGPIIDKLAKSGNKQALKLPKVNIKGKPFCFSYSGIKTHMKYFLQSNTNLSDSDVSDVCASFQACAVSQLGDVASRCLKEFPKTKQIVVTGGVAANSYLREHFTERFASLKTWFPQKKYCSDNAAMIASFAHDGYQSGELKDLRNENWEIYTRYDFTRKHFRI